MPGDDGDGPIFQLARYQVSPELVDYRRVTSNRDAMA